MDFLNEIRTLEEKELILSEIDAVKRKDFKSVRLNMVERLVELKDSLENDLKKLEVVKVILAINPTVGMLDLLDSFFKDKLDKKVIFDIEVDPKIIGGIQIVYNGNYGDYTVLKSIEGGM
jgi:F0F1-type ATP synthase delta subunit